MNKMLKTIIIKTRQYKVVNTIINISLKKIQIFQRGKIKG